MGLGQYDNLGEYCGPHTASSVFLILIREVEGLSQVFVSADGSLQVRRAKALLRKAAYIAKGEGCEVEMSHDRIMIN